MQYMKGVLDQGVPEKVTQVIDMGADVNQNIPGLTTPPLYYLITLTQWDSAEMAKALLDKGANPNYIHPTNKDQDPVLIKAIKQEKYKIAKALIEGGADPNLLNKAKESPLLKALHKSSLVKLLIEKGADPTLRVTNLGTTVLIEAVKEKMWSAIDNLVDACEDAGIPFGPIANATDTDGMNAAFYLDSKLGLDILADLDVDLNHKDNLGNTPLISAMDSEDEEFILEFLKYDIDINAANNEGDTALTVAIGLGMPDASVLALIEKGANVNHKRPSDGITPLMLAANADNLEIVELLLENNADKTAKNNEGFTAYDLASSDAVKALLGVVEPEEPSPPWTGLTQSDIAIFDTFFTPGPPEDPEANKINWSCCPVCLAYVYRSEACRYMSHDCTKQAGVILHKRLYDLYKKENKMIEWCTVCGRVCNGHHHYKLAPHESTTRAEPAPYTPAAAFYFGGEAECIKDGGGGIAEKVKRLDRLRTWAKELQNEVGKITERDARRQLIEEAWNAPLSRAPTARILQEGKFTVPSTDFPAAAPAAAAPEAPAPDIPKPADEVANVPEIIEAGGFDVILQYDTAPVARFVHKKKDGTVYRHTDQELVSKEGLEAYITNQNTNFGLPNFGYCFAPGCDAKLWPQDVKDLIDDAAVYEDYRKKFNEKFKAMQGGGKPLFVQATGVVCPKKKAGRKTYRRKGQMMRKKTRRNNK